MTTERACTRCGNHTIPDGRFCAECGCCLDCGLIDPRTKAKWPADSRTDDAATCDCAPLPLRLLPDLRYVVALCALADTEEALNAELDEVRCLSNYAEHCEGEGSECMDDNGVRCDHDEAEREDVVGGLCAVCSHYASAAQAARVYDAARQEAIA